MAFLDRSFAPGLPASIFLFRLFILRAFYSRARGLLETPTRPGRRCFEFESGGPTRATRATAVEGNYVASSGRLLVKREKNIGQFEITPLFAKRDREAQVGRISCNGSRDRFRFWRLVRFSGTERHGISPRETRNSVLQGEGQDSIPCIG